MNILRIVVSDPDELLNTSAYGAGAKLRVEFSTNNGVSYTEFTTTALVSGQTIYTIYHQAGTTTTLYQSRYSDTGGTLFSEYSSPFSATTAPVEYATLPLVKLRLGLAATDTGDDSILEQVANEANDFLEGRIGYSVGPVASEIRTFDGDRIHYRHGIGYYLDCRPFGVRAVSAVRTATGTGGTMTSQTASDVLIRPASFERTPGWPGFELWIKDTATWGWTTYGYDVNEVTATWGWDVVPKELQAIATRLAIAAYRNRSYGAGAQNFVGEDIAGVAANELTSADWWTIDKFSNLRGVIG